MINKKIAFSVGIVGAVVAVSFAAAYSGNPFKKLRAADGPYELVLNNAVAESTLTSSYQNKVTTSVTTSEGNDISLALVLAKSASGAYVDLAPRGMIYNFESSAGQISGISGITVTYSSGSVSLKTSPFSLDGGAFLGEAAPLTNGVEYTLPVSAKYFQIIAGDNGALITSVVINYACDEAYTNVKVADGTYVGKTNDVTYEMIINNGATTLRTLDAQVPETYTGTTTLTNDQQLSFAFTYQGNQINYVTAISANGQTLTPVSTGGFPSITFYREYEVENFDSYTTTGQGYNSEATKTQTSGLRAAFYSDYSVASGGDSPIGDSTWALSHSDDYLLLGENQGRNNTNCAILKGSTNGLRYITMNSYYGVPQAIGKGAVLSFWVHGAYTNKTLTTESDDNITLKAYGFYNPVVTSTNINQRDEMNVTVIAHSDWTEYKVALEPSRTYYGFGFFCKPSSTVYLAIDDIRIYTYSEDTTPLVENYPDGTYSASIRVSGSWGSANVWTMIAIGGRIGDVYTLVSSGTLSATGITFDSSTNLITISATGTIDYSEGYEYSVGTITATYDEEAGQLKNVTYKDGSGNNISGINNNGSITMNMAAYFEGLNEDTALLRDKFKRRYNDGAWHVDDFNSDRITADNNNFVGGTGALKFRGYAGGLAGLCLQEDMSLQASSYKNFGFWVFNPSNNDIPLRLFLYKAPNLSNAEGDYEEIGGVTAKAFANGWTYCHMGFSISSGTLYNYQIAYANNATYLTFDNISIF